LGWYREYEQRRDLQVGYSRATHKYSGLQRQAAVEHYLDHGRCIAFTLKSLGYPCRETLSAWIDELHPEVRPRVVGRTPNIQRSTELKRAAVIDLCTRDTNAQ
jgi:putative transposase